MQFVLQGERFSSNVNGQHIDDNSHDFNDRLGGDSFETIRPDWETGDILEEWGKYAHSQMGSHVIITFF